MNIAINIANCFTLCKSVYFNVSCFHSQHLLVKVDSKVIFISQSRVYDSFLLSSLLVLLQQHFHHYHFLSSEID